MDRKTRILGQAQLLERECAEAGEAQRGRFLALYVQDQVRQGDLDALEVRLDSELQTPSTFVPDKLSWCESMGNDPFGVFADVKLKNVGFKMRYIPHGSFMMGSTENEEGRFENEGPRHEVVLTQGFWLGQVACTQALWEAVMGDNPSYFEGPGRPVERVSWNDCHAFFQKLNTLIPSLGAKLPTEAQWEYAARAGASTPRYGPLERIAWWRDNSERQTHPVGFKDANAFGLYDMLGHVFEWCADGSRSYSTETVYDPVGPLDEGGERVIRGGNFDFTAQHARAAYRGWYDSELRFNGCGFRFSRDK